MRRILLCGFLIGCVSPTATHTSVEGAKPFTATEQLATAWSAIESCSGLHRDFRSVSFYTASNIEYGDGYARGLWDPRTDRIYILATETANTPLLEHEIMHAHLGDAEGHPPHYFNGVCGNLMN